MKMIAILGLSGLEPALREQVRCKEHSTLSVAGCAHLWRPIRLIMWARCHEITERTQLRSHFSESFRFF